MILKNALGNDTEVVMWSWPSKRDGLAGNYNYDRESVTGEAQRELMNIFQALEMGSAEKPLILLSHSMGGWHVLGALRTLSDQHRGPKFRDVILAAPDIPADEFSFAFDALNSTTKRSTLYACAWDGALILSEEINDYRRAGTGGNNIDSRMGMDSIDVDPRLSLNHSYVFDNERVLRDVAALILTGANPGMVERGLIKVPKGSWHYWRFP
jgi:esterase/lipase superfamily enzyme